MGLNLITGAWVPVRRMSGAREAIAPHQITEGIDDDPVIAFDWPRADFDGACHELFIGLFAAALAPATFEKVMALALGPPTSAELKARLARFESAFDMCGTGPRFLQDLSGLPDRKADTPVSALLIDAPGAQGIKNNTDLFSKRGRVETISLPSAAMALYTLQAFAPAGGAGHRTSMRGGGPLTTMFDPRPQGRQAPRPALRSLWTLIAANMPPLDRLRADPPGAPYRDLFPWLAPTRTSEKGTGTQTHASNAHPLQQFFGMPRRIVLDVEPETAGRCDILGMPCDGLVRAYRTAPYGIDYGESWQHWLSPHYDDKGVHRPLHPQPDGFPYRHWLGLSGLNQGAEDNRITAGAIAVWQGQRVANAARLHAFGYDMDKMKGRAWYQSTMPAYPGLSPEQRERLAGLARDLVSAADKAVRDQRSRMKQALSSNPKDFASDLSPVAEAFWHDTEPDFFALVDRLAQGDPPSRPGESWHRIISRAILDGFDRSVGMDALEDRDFARITRARKGLMRDLNDKKMREILGLPAKSGKARAPA